MEHPRKALQGLNDNLVHRLVTSLASFAFPNRKAFPLQVHAFPLEIEHFALSHSSVQRKQNWAGIILWHCCKQALLFIVRKKSNPPVAFRFELRSLRTSLRG